VRRRLKTSRKRLRMEDSPVDLSWSELRKMYGFSPTLFSDEPCVQWLFKSNSTSVQYVTLRIKIA